MTRAEYYASIPHYCQYPQPDEYSISMGCWGILYGRVQMEADYCRTCEMKVMARRKVKHNKWQIHEMCDDGLRHCDAW